MAQIQSPETYADGQQVTAARLNNQTNGAILLPGVITDQTNIAANTVASGDSVLLYDLSATALREANVSDVLGSNVPVTTSAVTAGANSDIVLTPNDGVIVTGQAYTSGDGLTVTVTSTAHTLTVGQVILVTDAAAGYNGTFRVATVATNSFTYVMTTAATAGSSTLSYTKKGAIRNTGSESIDGSLFVAGASVVATSAVTGNQTVAGNQTVTGNQTVAGTATFNNAPQVLTSVIKPRFDYFVQTRTQAILTSGWGGLQNLINPFGTKITSLDLTFTPQKAGNKVVLTWNLFAEFTALSHTVLLVTRTPNSGVGAGVAVALPDAVDASNNTWSCTTVPSYGPDESSTPENTVIKIVDNNTLDVECTYSLHFRASSNITVTAYINRCVSSAGAFNFEAGMSLGHAHEIYT
jgi:hypothetical protein